MQLKCSTHKFPGIYSGSVNGKDTVWTKRNFTNLEDAVKFSRSGESISEPSQRIKPANLIVDDVSGASVFSEWDPNGCALSAGVLSGLFHFPVDVGDVVLVLGATCSTISHLADVVGPTGQIRAVISSPLEHESAIAALLSTHSNVWVHESSHILGEFDQAVEDAALFRVKAEILKASSFEGSACVFSKLGVDADVEKRVLSSIFSYLGTFPSSPSLTSVIALYPYRMTPVTPASLGEYEQYLMHVLQPLCSDSPKSKLTVSANLWITLSVPLSFLASFHSSDDASDTDLICERLFDVVGSCVNRLGSFRPKEQLRLDPKYFSDTMLLLSRCRKVSLPKPVISPDTSTRMIEEVLASLLSGAGQAPPGFPSQTSPSVDPQLAYDLNQAALSRLVSRGV
jgi:hypothetical protein